MAGSLYQIEILKCLIKGDKMASIDAKASNMNQYFCAIKKAGIALEESWCNNKGNTGRHKERSLEMSPQNQKSAEEYLKFLLKQPNEHKTLLDCMV